MEATRRTRETPDPTLLDLVPPLDVSDSPGYHLASLFPRTYSRNSLTQHSMALALSQAQQTIPSSLARQKGTWQEFSHLNGENPTEGHSTQQREAATQM